MAVTITTKKGKQVTLLNPSEKGRKFADELRNGAKQTNAGMIKWGKDGKPTRLTNEEKAYRSGYLDAQKDNAKAYKARQNKGGK